MRQKSNTTAATHATAASTSTPAANPTAPAATPVRKPAAAKAIPAAKIPKALRPPSVKAALARPTNPLMEQFVRDMVVAGHGEGTQATYLGAVQQFIAATWTSPEQATEAQLQSYLIALRERDVAGQTFRVQRFALQFLFQNTLARDWPLFKKN
jgi:hypothetical protein